MSTEGPKFDDIYKIVVLGDPKVGKSTFLSQYIPSVGSKNHINDMEAGTEILPNKKIVNLQVWDLTGDPSYRSLTGIFTKKSLGAFVLFDISNPASFKSVKNWVTDLTHQSPDCQIIIIGNKSDLRGKIETLTEFEARSFCRTLNADYFEISSLDKEEVETLFKTLVLRIFRSRSSRNIPLFQIALFAAFLFIIYLYINYS